jgi:hypothetical protein
MHKVGFIVFPAFSPINFAATSVFETRKLADWEAGVPTHAALRRWWSDRHVPRVQDSDGVIQAPCIRHRHRSRRHRTPGRYARPSEVSSIRNPAKSKDSFDLYGGAGAGRSGIARWSESYYSLERCKRDETTLSKGRYGGRSHLYRRWPAMDIGWHERWPRSRPGDGGERSWRGDSSGGCEDIGGLSSACRRSVSVFDVAGFGCAIRSHSICSDLCQKES